MKTSHTSLRLTERDLLLMADIYRFGTLLRDQIHGLHFRSCDLRRCNRRLHALTEAGYLTAQTLPLGPVSRMSIGNTLASGGQLMYRLTIRAVPLVAHCLGLDVSQVRQRVRSGTPSYLAHSLEVAQIACHLLHPPAGSGWDGLTTPVFRSEVESTQAYEYRNRNGDDGWKREVVKPDAYSLLTISNTSLSAFWEIDLGHTSATEWAKKIAIYDRYRATGLFESRFGRQDFAVLTLTTVAERAANLCQIVAASGLSSVPFGFALLNEFCRQGPLAPIWGVSGQAAPVTLYHITERTNS